jgi:hypothetical protein
MFAARAVQRQHWQHGVGCVGWGCGVVRGHLGVHNAAHSHAYCLPAPLLYYSRQLPGWAAGRLRGWVAGNCGEQHT